jgi:hypothetical protein
MSGAMGMLLASGGGPKYTGDVTFIYSSDYFTYSQFLYLNGSSGTANPSTLTDGRTFQRLSTYLTGFPTPVSTTNTVAISGFGSDPGSTYLTSVTVAGTLYSLAGATYVYSAGTATWTDTASGVAWISYIGPSAVVLK